MMAGRSWLQRRIAQKNSQQRRIAYIFLPQRRMAQFFFAYLLLYVSCTSFLPFSEDFLMASWRLCGPAENP